MYARLQFSQFLNGWSYSAIETVSIALSVATEKVSSIVAVSVVTEKVTADTFFKKSDIVPLWYNYTVKG